MSADWDEMERRFADARADEIHYARRPIQSDPCHCGAWGCRNNHTDLGVAEEHHGDGMTVLFFALICLLGAGIFLVGLAQVIHWLWTVTL